MTFKVACIQNCASNDLLATIEDAAGLTREAHENGADLVCLPEFFSYLHLDEIGLDVAPFKEDEHPTLAVFQTVAEERGMWILLGSIAVYENDNETRRNRSIVLDPEGKIVMRYDKIHMFDVNLPNGETYRESEIFEPGDSAAIVDLPWGVLGLTVCYDLRFPYLYRTLAKAGADIISVPAAFTRTTGQAHWHVLLRSRAIETGCYIVAPCQYGDHGKARTYGHSLIIDPWGEVLSDGGEGRGYIMADINVEEVSKARQRIPALQHDRKYYDPAHHAIQQQLLREAS